MTGQTDSMPAAAKDGCMGRRIVRMVFSKEIESECYRDELREMSGGRHPTMAKVAKGQMSDVKRKGLSGNVSMDL